MRKQVVFGIFVAVLGLSPMVARAATVPELIEACQRGSENACRRLEKLQSRSQNQNRGVSNDQMGTLAVQCQRGYQSSCEALGRARKERYDANHTPRCNTQGTRVGGAYNATTVCR